MGGAGGRVGWDEMDLMQKEKKKKKVKITEVEVEFKENVGG